MKINRRDFLKATAATGAILGTSSLACASDEGHRDMSKDVSMLNDSTLCIGCRACMIACKAHHGQKPLVGPSVDKDITINRSDNIEQSKYDIPLHLNSENHTIIKAYVDKKKNLKQFVKKQCMHCAHPGCVSACPVAALQKVGDPSCKDEMMELLGEDGYNKMQGVVTYNKYKCIGCRYCMLACPFEVPTFEYDEPFPVIQKCDFCGKLDVDKTGKKDNIAQGKPSQCAYVCPVEAIKFGTREEMIELAKSRYKQNPERYLEHPNEPGQPWIFGEKELGGTSVFVLTSKNVGFDKIGYNKNFKRGPGSNINKMPEKIMHTTFWYFIPPVAYLGALGLIHLATKNKGGE